MPNSFAYIMLFAWPFVAVLLFRLLPLQKALIWTILGGYLVLPVRTEVDFPLIPALDKVLIPSLAVFVLCLLIRPLPGETQRGWLPEHRLARVLVLVYLFGPFVTGLLNNAPVMSGGGYLPGLTPYDAASFASSHAVMLLPFLLGRRHLAGPGAHRTLLICLVGAGLTYSVPILIEIWLSPQLHTWVYGFFPHSFIQHIRFGGYRPVVFQEHGLRVAIFVALSLVAAVALWRSSRGALRVRLMLAAGWLALVLVLCKSIAALVFAAVMALVVGLAGRRVLRLAVVGAAVTVLLYPMLRGVDLVPTQSMVSAAQSVDPGRAGSLGFRFENEDSLMQRANARPLFGWGGWSRNRIRDDQGADTSVTDGRWIITMGVFGWSGYLAEFGLLTLGIFALFARGVWSRVGFVHAALGALLAVNLLDLLPNSSLTPVTWLVAGALLGAAERLGHPSSAPGRWYPGQAPRLGPRLAAP